MPDPTTPAEQVSEAGIRKYAREIIDSSEAWLSPSCELDSKERCWHEQLVAVARFVLANDGYRNAYLVETEAHRECVKSRDHYVQALTIEAEKHRKCMEECERLRRVAEAAKASGG